jgi:hypothetical protein
MIIFGKTYKFNSFENDVFRLKKIKISDTDLFKKGFATIKYWEENHDCSEEDRKYNIDLITKMMSCHETLQPIVVDCKNNVIDGFHTLTALNELGKTHVMAYKKKGSCPLKTIYNILVKKRL